MEGQGHLGVALAAAQVHIESVFHGNQILLVVKSAHLLDLVRECKHDVTGREGTRGVVVMGGVKHADRVGSFTNLAVLADFCVPVPLQASHGLYLLSVPSP